jgi:DNA-directed RNA polymerase specialized sigma24 family protein
LIGNGPSLLLALEILIDWEPDRAFRSLVSTRRFFYYDRVRLDMRSCDQKAEAVTGRIFATTHWSVVVTAGQGESGPAQRALETLCCGYWYPIYVYVRRKGYGPDEAQDLTQEFFAQLIAKDHVRRANRERGKFRTFLLATLDYFLAREWSRAHRQKRGGQFSFISLDYQASEERYRLEPADHDTPERKFLRQWALTLLKQVMSDLESECASSGKGTLFREVKRLLSGDRDGSAYVEIGERLAMHEGAVRVAVCRLRRRYGELLRAEIARTVSGPEEVDEELRYLLRILSE